jgi:hypothetical protein
MATFNFERETRTSDSEAFVIEANGDEIGRVDLHYAGSTAYATLCVPNDFDDDAIEELIGEIDERLVMSSGDDDDDDDDDDDLDTTNGNR